MGGCSCVYAGDFDGPSVYDESYVKARKTHKCCECHRIIEKGERYKKVSGLWDGEWSRYSLCLDCESVSSAFFCDGIAFERMWENLADHFCDTRGKFDSDCLTKLTKSARDKVCDLIESYWEDEEQAEPDLNRLKIEFSINDLVVDGKAKYEEQEEEKR